jgi:hypothetical protein
MSLANPSWFEKRKSKGALRMAMHLVIEFLPSFGQTLKAALPSVQTELDKEFGEFGLERVASLLAMKEGAPCQKIHYSLKEGAKPVKLPDVIDMVIRKVASSQGRGSINWWGKTITKAVTLTAYLETVPRQ